MGSMTPAKTAIPPALKLLPLVVILALIITLFNSMYIVPPRGNRFDFYPRWRGAQALWQGQSPYTADVTRAIQEGMFGGALPPTADQQMMVYPAYVGVILAPFLLVSSHTAIAIWLTIQLIAVLATPLIWLQILDWKPRPWLLGVLIVGLVIVFRYPINLYIVGQFTGTILFGLSLALWLFQQRRDTTAGLLLALTAMPPTIAIPLALVVLGGFALVGRPRALIAFVAALVVLTAITLVQIGWWIPDFVAQIQAYQQYSFPVWTPGLIESPILRVGLIVGVGLALLLGVVCFRQTRQVETLAVSAILACLLLVPQTGNYYLVLLIPPLLVIFQRGGWLRRVEVGLAIVSPWLMRALPTPSLEALLLPLYVLALWLPTLAQPVSGGRLHNTP